MTIFTIPSSALAATLAKAHAGDVIELSGSFTGTTSLYHLGEAAGVITIRPADPSAPPVLFWTKLSLCRNLAFAGGILWQGVNPSTDLDTANALLDVGSDCTDITVDGCKFRTAPSVNGWTADDWVRKPFHELLRARGTRMTITGNDLSKCRNALNIVGAKGATVKGNYIHQMGNDGIAFGGADQAIVGNTIIDSRHTAVEPLHADGMQGYPLTYPSSNILIEDNLIDMSGAVDGGVLTAVGQGISIFDGEWHGIRIHRNKVTVNGYNGIVVYGPDGCEIEANALRQGAGSPYVPWIQIAKAKNGRAPLNSSITNNVAPKILADTGVKTTAAAGTARA